MPFRKKSAKSTLIIVLIIIIVVTVAAGVFLFAWFWFRPSSQIVGSGNIVTEEMKLGDFTMVEVGSGFEVEITQSISHSVNITADDNVFDYIEASKAVETLRISLKPGIVIYESTLKAEITMPELYDLQLSGGTHGTSKGFHSSHDFVLGLSGGSHINLEGSANDLLIKADGGSHLDLSDFPVHNVNVNLSGGSHATINLDGRLDADVSGGSHLYYIGEPTMGDISESGGSEVSKK